MVSRSYPERGMSIQCMFLRRHVDLSTFSHIRNSQFSPKVSIFVYIAAEWSRVFKGKTGTKSLQN